MDSEYLKPGFDPSSLKVAQLRRILVENGVDFPPQSKKNSLVSLFEEHVKPEIPRLRSQYENLVPSDKGIVKVPVDASKKVKKKRDRQKKKKKERVEPAVLSGSENHDADSNSRSSVKPDQSVDHVATSPFSDVNEFQQGSVSKKKTRKRKIAEEEATGDREGDLDMGVSLELPSNEEKLEKKRRRKIGETEHTPITDKVAQKTPKKSPHTSLIIEKFETSSSSDSSFNESSILNVSRRGHAGTEKSDDQSLNKNDFSYDRRTLAPDLNQLKVSPAFADELKIAYKENSVPVLARPESHSELEINYISGPAEISVVKETTEPSAEASGITDLMASIEKTESSEEEGNNFQAVIENVDSFSPGGIADEKNEDEGSVKISPPHLPTEEDVLVCEERVKNVQDLIEKENRSSKEVESIPPATRSFLKPVGSLLYRITLFLLMVTPMLYGLWYREQRVSIGYCGHEMEKGKLFDSSIPVLSKIDDFLEEQKPDCLPCPSHAICYPLMQMKCQPEYSLRRNKWSLFDLLPLGDRCVKDTQRERLVSEVVKKSLEFLRMKNAQYSCGECKDDLKSGMTEEELYQIFYESRAPWINDTEFDELWTQAVSDLIEEPEIMWRQVSTNSFLLDNTKNPVTNNLSESLQLPNSGSSAVDGSNDQITAHGFQGKTGHFSQTDGEKETRILRSTSKKYIGLRCKFEREIYQTYNKYAYLIWAAIAMISLTKFGSYRIRKYYKQCEVVDDLSKKVLNKLKEAKQQGQVPPFLSVVQLRDVLLADTTNLKFKNELWQAVVKTLERNNTNVRSTLMEIHGEIMKCWEWIGPIDGGPAAKESKDSQK